MIVVEGGARLVGQELDVAGDPRPADGDGPDGVRAGPPGVSAGVDRAAEPTRARSRRSWSPPAPAAGWAAGTSWRPSCAGGRCCAGRSRRWPPPVSTRIVIATSPGRVAEIAAEPWLPDAVVAVVAGGERRQESVAAGVAAWPKPLADAEAAPRTAPDCGREPAGDATPPDPVILVHDAARPLASPGPGPRRRRGRRPATAPPSRSARDRDAQAARRRSRRGHRRPDGRRRRPDAAGRRGAACSSGPTPHTLPTAPKPGPTRPRCWRPVESRSMRSAAKRRISR